MKNKSITNVGTILRDRRMELDLTQSDVARMAKVHRGSIANIETSKSGVSFETLSRLVDALS